MESRHQPLSANEGAPSPAVARFERHRKSPTGRSRTQVSSRPRVNPSLFVIDAEGLFYGTSSPTICQHHEFHVQTSDMCTVHARFFLQSGYFVFCELGDLWRAQRISPPLPLAAKRGVGAKMAGQGMWQLGDIQTRSPEPCCLAKVVHVARCWAKHWRKWISGRKLGCHTLAACF